MQQVIMMHSNIANALYEIGVRGFLNNQRVAADSCGGLAGLYFEEDTIHQDNEVTDATWEEYFGVLAALMHVQQLSEVITFDIDLAWGVDRVLPIRLTEQYRQELVASTSELLLAVMAQENPMVHQQLEKLKWCKLVAVRSHQHLTEFTFGSDVRIDRYMELLDEYHNTAGPIEFNPAIQFCQATEFVRGLRHAAKVSSPKPRFLRSAQR